MVIETFVAAATLASAADLKLLAAPVSTAVASAHGPVRAPELVRPLPERRRAPRPSPTLGTIPERLAIPLQRLQAAQAVTEADALLRRTEVEIAAARRDDARIALDGALFRLESARRLLRDDARLEDLDRRERELRLRLDGFDVVPIKLVPREPGGEAPPARPVKLPRRDELPVG